MASSPAPFQYDRIDIARDAIRLIRLCKGFDTNPIRCELSEVLLDEVEGVPYSALSYTWGDPSKRVDIILNGQTISITANLYHALYCLRRSDIDQYLWVDAICIDQNHHGERSHQVGQMRRVYEKAENVTIWLGRITDEIDLLLDAVNALDRRVKAIPRRKQRWPETWQSEWKSLLKEMGGPEAPFYELRKQALQELLARPWFTRVWVVQEAASARTATIACGWKRAPTRTFAAMPFLMGIKTNKRSESLLEAMPGPLRESSIWSTTPDLHSLLSRFDDCNAEDPRDQIYALLGISSDASGSNSLLRANYQLDLSQSLRETVSFLVFGEVLDCLIFDMRELRLGMIRLPLNKLSLLVFEWALKNSNIALADRLVSNNAVNLNQLLPRGSAPLLCATSANASPQLIEWLLDHKDLDTTAFNQGSESLCHAAKVENWQIVRVLLSKRGVGVTYLTSSVMTPLAHAVRAGYTDIAVSILQYDHWGLQQRYSDIREAPLVLATQYERTEILEYMLFRSPHGSQHDHVVQRAAFLVASMNGDLPSALLLIKAGTEVHGGAYSQVESPLQAALARGHAQLVHLILENHGQLKSREECLLAMPLCGAARKGYFDSLRLVVDRAANFSCTCRSPECPAWRIRGECTEVIMDILRQIQRDGEQSKALYY